MTPSMKCNLSTIMDGNSLQSPLAVARGNHAASTKIHCHESPLPKCGLFIYRHISFLKRKQ